MSVGGGDWPRPAGPTPQCRGRPGRRRRLRGAGASSQGGAQHCRAEGTRERAAAGGGRPSLAPAQTPGPVRREWSARRREPAALAALRLLSGGPPRASTTASGRSLVGEGGRWMAACPAVPQPRALSCPSRALPVDAQPNGLETPGQRSVSPCCRGLPPRFPGVTATLLPYRCCIAAVTSQNPWLRTVFFFFLMGVTPVTPASVYACAHARTHARVRARQPILL